MNSIRAVCFDIGGVLAMVGVTWADAMSSAGLEPSRNSSTPYEELDAFTLFQAGQLDIEAYLDELADYLGIDSQMALRVHEHILLRPTDGTLEIIAELHANGILTGCLSNTNTLHWPVLNDANRFPNVVALQFKAASQLIGFNKPALESFRTFESMVGAEPAEIIFFEDSPGNVEGARNAGWNAILVNPTGGQEAQIRQALAGFQVL